jgi:MoaA/NifB/PqqE/SkfB family radical SAM enzyme
LQKKGPLYILPWRCTFVCNYNCVHCTSTGKPAAQDEINTEDAKRIVDQAYEFGASFFGITGEEALLRKDLFEVIAYAREVGLNAGIITDGRLLHDKAFESIVKNEVKVSVSIDGWDATNDLVREKGATFSLFILLAPN